MEIKELKFSIVVVCLNAGRKLAETVDSIRAQTYQNLEILIKDGGSTDHSLEALPEDERIKIVNMPDSGIYDAMNQGIAMVTGDFVFFLNCGDLFYDERVLSRVSGGIQEYAEKTGISCTEIIAYGDIYEQLRKERVSSNPNINGFACYRNIPCHQACFYAAALMRAKGFDTKFAVRADYEQFLWCYFEGNAVCLYLPLLVASYEGGGFSETKENARKAAAEHRQITALYMKKRHIFCYRLLLALTFSGLRTRLAHNKKTAHFYNKLKALLYGRKKP